MDGFACDQNAAVRQALCTSSIAHAFLSDLLAVGCAEVAIQDFPVAGKLRAGKLPVPGRCRTGMYRARSKEARYTGLCAAEKGATNVRSVLQP